MTNSQKMDTNIELSEKLMNFISSNPNLAIKYSGCSYVVFSMDDPKLNESNEELVKDLKKEGKRVVKAKETRKKDTPWEFVVI